MAPSVVHKAKPVHVKTKQNVTVTATVSSAEIHITSILMNKLIFIIMKKRTIYAKNMNQISQWQNNKFQFTQSYNCL